MTSESASCHFHHPISEDNYMVFQIVVIQITMRIIGQRFSYNKGSIQTIRSLYSRVGMVEVSSSWQSLKTATVQKKRKKLTFIENYSLYFIFSILIIFKSNLEAEKHLTTVRYFNSYFDRKYLRRETRIEIFLIDR